MKSIAQHSDLVIGIALADIALILLTGMVLGRLARFVRQPPVIGEIAAGIALGPSLLGLLPGDLPNRIFPQDVRPTLSVIAQVGVIVFMFGIGWELDKELIYDRRGAAVAVSLGSVALAFGLGAMLATFLYSHHSAVNGRHIPFTAFILFMGAAMSVTALPVLARILADHGMFGTRVGALALASAAIDDVLAWCLLSMVAAIVTANGQRGLFQVIVLSVAYVAVMALVVRPLLAALVRRYVRGSVPPQLMIVFVAGLFLSAFATTWIGIHEIFGAFAFGFIMPRKPTTVLRAELRTPLDNISLILLPVFFVVTGLSVNIGSITGKGYIELTEIVLVACAGKLFAAAVTGKIFGLSSRDAGILGLLMNTRGLTQLIMISAGASLGLLDRSLFTMLVLMALITTAMTGLFLPKAVSHADDLAQPVETKRQLTD